MDGLKVDRLRLIVGTSMGCMHAFVWGEAYPGFAQALMPMACQSVELAGRNRMWRQGIIDIIQSDPDWKGGDYTSPPVHALRAVAIISVHRRLGPPAAADRLSHPRQGRGLHRARWRSGASRWTLTT